LAIEGPSQSKGDYQNNTQRPYDNRQFGNRGYCQPNWSPPSNQYQSNWTDNNAQSQSNWTDNADSRSIEEQEIEAYWSNLYHNNPDEYEQKVWEEEEAFMVQNDDQGNMAQGDTNEMTPTIDNYHVDQDPPPPKCSICKRTFTSKNQLHQHLNTEHGKSAKN